MEEQRLIIFLGGVHGVGKTRFALGVQKSIGLLHFSASGLIRKYKKATSDENKRVSDINSNQNALIDAVRLFTPKKSAFLLDGHFCILNYKGDIERIASDVFYKLFPAALILLRDEPEVIASRQTSRDGESLSPAFIKTFQEEEIKAAEELSLKLDIPLMLMAPHLNRAALDFITGILQKG